MKINIGEVYHPEYPQYGTKRYRRRFLWLPKAAYVRELWSNRDIRWLCSTWVLEGYYNNTRESWKHSGPGTWKIHIFFNDRAEAFKHYIGEVSLRLAKLDWYDEKDRCMIPLYWEEYKNERDCAVCHNINNMGCVICRGGFRELYAVKPSI